MFGKDIFRGVIHMHIFFFFGCGIVSIRIPEFPLFYSYLYLRFDDMSLSTDALIRGPGMCKQLRFCVYMPDEADFVYCFLLDPASCCQVI